MEELRKNAYKYLRMGHELGVPLQTMRNLLEKHFRDVPDISNVAVRLYKEKPVKEDPSLKGIKELPVELGDPRRPDTNEEALRKHRRRSNPMRQLPAPWPKPPRLSASNETESPSEASTFMTSLEEKMSKKKSTQEYV